jgi:light-regulated signal transduction histidine kinase (bacteriophytochrome)
MVICEKTHIEEVFLSLLNNSVKYNDNLVPEIHISYEDNGFFWKFGVKDNGRGIDEKYFKKIFQIFQTLKTKDELESTGVGLSLARKIIELHGGRIWVESTLGVGTTVFFTLPKEG